MSTSLPRWFTNPQYLEDDERRVQSLWIWTYYEIKRALPGWEVSFLPRRD